MNLLINIYDESHIHNYMLIIKQDYVLFFYFKNSINILILK